MAVMITTEPTAAAGRIGLARWTPAQLWQVPTFVVGLCAVALVAASSPIRLPSEARQFDAAVRTLRQGLQKGQDVGTLLPFVDTVLGQLHEHGDRAAEVHFLAGSVYFRQALGAAQEPAKSIWPRVVERLEEALQLGSDESDVPLLEYRLGWALYALDRDVPRALELMARSIDRTAEPTLAGHQLLLQAYLKLPVPDLDKAIDASRRVVELTDDRDAEAVAEARFAHVQLLLRRDLRAEAIRELDRIGAKASRPLRARARLLQARTCEQERMWSKALGVWQELARDAAHVPGGKARALYAVGCCSVQLEPPDYLRAVKAWQEALSLGELAGQAAGLRLGGLRLFLPNADVAQALEDWRCALAKLQPPAEYQNPYFPPDDARTLFDQALALFQESQDYERMQTVAELYRKLLPPGQADAKVAQAAEKLAEKLMSEPEPPIKEVQAHWRRAGELWELSAQARSAREGFDALWHSANSFLRAREADQATRVLLQLEKRDQEDVRLAEGWYLLAELRRSAGNIEDAKQAYYRSMQYATTPFAAQARYQLAHEAAERKRWDKAAEILQPNLDGPPVDRDAHEKSLYEMAGVQLQKLDFGRAAFYLDKATVLYPSNPDALRLRGQLAECYRQFANQAYQMEAKAREDFQGSITPEQQSRLDEYVLDCRTKRQEWLRKAADTYEKIAEVLREQEARRPLTAMEAVLGRRALLSMAECRHDRGEYLEALRLYHGLMKRYRAKIESLVACVRIVQLCKLALGTELLALDGQQEVAATAKSALHLALEDLKKMDKLGPDFRAEKGTTVWSWEDWQRWTTDEQQRLNAPPLAPMPLKGSLFQ
jgi:tetratricopeptide (TPR) repeat protein